MMASVGEQLSDDPDEVCGVCCNLRQNRGHRLEVWTRAQDDSRHRSITCVARARGAPPRSSH